MNAEALGEAARWLNESPSLLASVRRTNDDPLDDTWEWLLFNGTTSTPVAISWNSYASKAGAWRALRRYARQLHVGVVAYRPGGVQ